MLLPIQKSLSKDYGASKNENGQAVFSASVRLGPLQHGAVPAGERGLQLSPVHAGTVIILTPPNINN
jgi:hypothetical protein